MIADEPQDNLIRASPLLLIPLMIPVNLDLLFFTFTIFFYTYGIYLHCGYYHHVGIDVDDDVDDVDDRDKHILLWGGAS